MSLAIPIRRFNSQGTDLFSTLVRSKPDDLLDRIDAILNDDQYAESVVDTTGSQVTIPIVFPQNRLDLAEMLWPVFGHGGPFSDRAGDNALWNWLSAAWMRTLVEQSPDKKDRVLGKQEARWVLTSDVLRYHRHLLSGPFFAYEANLENPRNAMCLLSTPVTSPGEVVERIAGKRSLSIGSVCHLATLLYFDPSTGQLRSGHTSGPGSPKSFSYYFSQLDVNVDYLGMDVEALLEILPSNFDKWKSLAIAELMKG